MRSGAPRCARAGSPAARPAWRPWSAAARRVSVYLVDKCVFLSARSCGLYEAFQGGLKKACPRLCPDSFSVCVSAINTVLHHLLVVTRTIGQALHPQACPRVFHQVIRLWGGQALRFVVGHSADAAQEAALAAEERAHGDFFRLDLQARPRFYTRF